MVEHFARAGRPRLLAALLRRFGPDEIDLLEGAVQDALLRALERWPIDGVPSRAEGWLVRVGHNLAVDALRRRSLASAAVEGVPRAPGAPGAAEDEPGAARAVDDQLCLMFLCCHPALPRSAQVALTLKIACGFSTQQIALAFLTDEATLAQRVVRAKQQLRRARPVFELPDADELPARLEPILDVLYVVFGEGHSPTNGDAAIKQELCDEALRLARIVAPLSPAASALCALFSFQASRSAARLADDGSLLLLPEQDRARWDRELIALGFGHLEAAAHGAELSSFHLEAGIAACHAAAATHAATDWEKIVELYGVLHARAPSPVIDVNRAIAIAMLSGAHAGLDELDAIPEREIIERYPYALAAYAELHASLGELDQARTYLDRALAHQPSHSQRALLERKRAALAR